MIWADNTKGKSTGMQAMLYVLGMEKMLSPSREVPVPHALTTYLMRDDESELAITNSYVELGRPRRNRKRREICFPGSNRRLVARMRRRHWIGRSSASHARPAISFG